MQNLKVYHQTSRRIMMAFDFEMKEDGFYLIVFAPGKGKVCNC